MKTSIPELIQIKRGGHEWTEDQVRHLVRSIVTKQVAESQIGAMLMAIVLNGIGAKETAALTKAMVETGDRMKWPSEWRGQLVDKHSTGGVGDKVSLILAPALASAGLKVPMVSGRGLSFTGGTLDKLESIPGFQVEATATDMLRILAKSGCCIVGQSKSVAPADKEMYRIRDVTATVDYDPLITSSIMSKKVAESIDALVLDVKVGRGAFKKSHGEAEDLARCMILTGNQLGVKTCAFLTNMDTPLGRCVGNSLEVLEAVHTLQGRGPDDLVKLVLAFGGKLLQLSGKVATSSDGEAVLSRHLTNGLALKSFHDMILAQGVNEETAKQLCYGNAQDVLPKSPKVSHLTCPESGFVHGIDSMAVAQVCQLLGSGRSNPGDTPDLSVGLVLQTKIGDSVCQGDVWCTVHHRGNFTEDMEKMLLKGIDVRPSRSKPADLILAVLE